MITDYFVMAYHNLRRRKLRSWLTMIGIFMSIAIIFVLISLSLGLEKAIEEEFQKLGSDKFFVMPRGQLAGPGSGGAVKLTENDVEVIERVSGVRETSYFVTTSAKVQFREDIRFVTVVGIKPDKASVLIDAGYMEPQTGKILERGDRGKALTGSQYSDKLFSRPVEVGDKLTINDVHEVKVKGILEPIGSPPDDRLVYIDQDTFNEIFPEIGDRVDQISVQVEQGEDVEEVAERVKKRLLQTRGVKERNIDFTISTPEELLNSFSAILNIITAFLLGVAAISLVVGGIGVANTMYTAILERVKEIGVMKAIGAQNKDILLIFMIEAGMIGLVGGVIGVVLGIGISKAVEFVAAQQLGTGFLQAATPIYLIVGCLAFAFVVGAFSGTWPAWKATKIRPVEALRYE